MCYAALLAAMYLPLTALEALGEKDWRVPEEAVRRGLAEVRWPGRFEVLGRAPVFLLDGAHNAHGMRAAAESLRILFPGRKLTFLLGILADKDAGEMLDLLAPLAETGRDGVICALGSLYLCGEVRSAWFKMR